MRLGDLDELIRKGTSTFDESIPIADFIDLADSMPTVDAEPIRYGKWVTVDEDLSVYQCSKCGDIRQIDDIPIFDFCPRCGARMEGE